MIEKFDYDNGLTLLVEPIGGVASVGMTLLLPGGTASEPADRLGAAAVLSDCVFRGAGELDAKAHSDALDQLGVKRGCAVQTYHLRLSATFIGHQIEQAMPLLTDMVRRPRLIDEGFEPARQLAVQAIDALEDEPQEKLMIELKAAHLPGPLSRSAMGDRDHLLAMNNADVRAHHARTFVPGGAIIALSGDVQPARAHELVGRLLGDWSGKLDRPAADAAPTPAYHHHHNDSAQQHIGIAYDAMAASDERAPLQHVATAVLSGGMSGRLFTEVREKRGLCYAVYAGYSSLLDRGAVTAYAGTTTERATETLDVLGKELRRLYEGVGQDEFERAVVGLKSRIVMQGESTSARASAIAQDEFLLGRPRTLDDCAAEVDAVTLDKLNAFLAENKPGEMTTVTIGPQPLIGQQA